MNGGIGMVLTLYETMQSYVNSVQRMGLRTQRLRLDLPILTDFASEEI